MISLLLPTRKRPHRLKTFIESVRQTESNRSEICVYVDWDDTSYALEDFRTDAKMFFGPKEILSDYWNVLAKNATGEILMLCADDLVFKTQHWDLIVEDAFAKVGDRIILVYGDDGKNGNNFATHPAISRKWVQTLGHMTGSGFSSGFADTWMWDVASKVQRIQYVPILTEHKHWLFGKAEKDEVYEQATQAYYRDNPEEKYKEREAERVEDARKLWAVMDHPKPLHL